MASIKLKAEVREERGTRAARKLRRQGWAPAVVYGDGQESIPLKISAKELHKALHRGGGEHAILELYIEGGNLPKPLKKTVIVKEVQHDYLKDFILHVDFTVISLKEKLVVKVPVVETGEAVGVHKGGVLEHIMRELEIECLPADLPENIAVDVSNLDIGGSIKLADIVPPRGVKILDEPELTVFTVTPPRVEEVAAPAEEAAEEAAEAAAPEAEAEQKTEKAAKEGESTA